MKPNQSKKSRSAPVRLGSGVRLRRPSTPERVPITKKDQKSNLLREILADTWISSEMEAQRYALLAINSQGIPQKVRESSRKALLDRPIASVPSVEECLTRAALALLAGLPSEGTPEGLQVTAEPVDQHMFERLALGWTRWVSQGDLSIFVDIPKMRQETNNPSDYETAVNLSILHIASLGIEQLVRGKYTEAYQYLSKSIDIAEAEGSDYTSALKWIFVLVL